MKNLKRVLCIALTLVLGITSMGVFAASFSDVPTTAAYEEAVSSLSQLGIIKGYDDGTFKPEQNVNRAEFTAMLMRTMNQGNVGQTTAEGLPFSDLNNQDTSWAIPNIATAQGQGIVNGYDDGTFKPTENVLYEEAFKMIVCALGYGGTVSQSGPWYSDYMATANRVGILKKASSMGAPGTPATRACIAQMLYDTLEVPVVEQDKITTKTFLSDYLGYIKNTGVIASNDKTSLSSYDVNLRDNEIQIRAKEPDSKNYEVHTYTTAGLSNASFKDKLGYQVEFFYKNNNDEIRTLFSCELKGNNVTEINANDIDVKNSTATQIKYLKDDAKTYTNASVSSESIVVYNGKLYGTTDANSRFSPDMIPDTDKGTIGKLSLLDSDSDGKADVILIDEYEVYYVSSKSSSDYRIVDNVTRMDPDPKSLTLDIEDSSIDLSIVNTSGATVTFSSIGTGSVVCYAVSQDHGTPLAKAVVVTDSKSGTISQRMTGESITIGDTSYDYSNAAPWMKYSSGSPLEEPATNDSGKYVFDLFGDLVAYDATVSPVTQLYGYVMGYSSSSNPLEDDDSQIRVLTQDGSKKDYYVYKNTTVNGKEYSTGEAVREALSDTAKLSNTDTNSGLSVQQVIKFTTKNYKGRLCLDEIYTVTKDSVINDKTGIDLNNKTLTYMKLVNASTEMKYSSNKLSGNGIDLGVSGSYVFLVPSERTDRDGYKKSTASSSFRNNQKYEVEAFDVSKTGAAKVIVLYGVDASSEVNSGSPVYVIEEIGQEQNSAEDQTMYRIKGIKVSPSGSASTFNDWVSTESNSLARSLEPGAIVRPGTDSDGFTTLSEYNPKDSDDRYLLYPTNEAYLMAVDDQVKNINDASLEELECVVLHGSIKAADSKENVVVMTDKIYTSNDKDADNAETTMIPASSFSNAKMLKFDTTNSKIAISDVTGDGYESVLGGLAGFTGSSTPSEVLVYMSDGKVKLFVVIE